MPENAQASEDADLDTEAMRRLASGDDRALTEIMERWKIRLSAYLLRFTGSEIVARDLAQETFVRLYQSHTRFRPTASRRCFSTWLFGIASNLARNHLRWQGRHPTVPLEEAGDPTASGDPAASAQQEERSRAVGKAIAGLASDLRETLILSEYEGLSHAEIGVIAGCSVKAVERRLSHAREQLRKALSRYLKGN
jgi:RNA polymerase sigma-70 factor, ECF subfamily